MGSGALYGAVGGLVLLVALAFVAGLYNSLVRVRTQVQKAWSNIDVLLMQRHAEIPNLVEVVKGYAAHERQALEAVTALRARYEAAQGSEARAVLENLLNPALLGLFARVEAYPTLKADASFLKLQARLSELESAIAERREHFNDCVAIHNTKIQRFPDALFARRLGFGLHPFLEAPGAERRTPAVGFGTAS